MALKEILTSFLKHVAELESKNGEGYNLEFQRLKEESQEFELQLSESGKSDVTRAKNRYKDILPYDHSRVVLTELDSTPGSDYINASFIQNVSGQRAYIAAQAPLVHTLTDFWRMIHQYKVMVIVMACNEKELGRQKCERYWAKENEEKQFGNITVTSEKVWKNTSSYLGRKLMIKAADEVRTVYQFHYTGWPDHGIPTSVEPLLKMMREVRDYQPSENIPIVVHCSAGCGRTGTICVIDYSWNLLKFGKLNADFSVYNILLKMRRQRKAMVQTKDQYILLHQAIAELFKEKLVHIENNLYENIKNIKGEDNMSTDYDQRIYDVDDTDHDYATVYDVEDLEALKLVPDNTEFQNLVLLKSSTDDCDLKDQECRMFHKNTFGLSQLENMESGTKKLDTNTSSTHLSPSAEKSTVFALKNIFDSPLAESCPKNNSCNNITVNRKNVDKLKRSFSEKCTSKAPNKITIDICEDSAQETFDADYDESDLNPPENYKNVTVIAQKNIEQITKTVEKYPRGAIIDLTSVSNYNIPTEKVHYETVNGTQEKSTCNSEAKKTLTESKKNTSPTQKFAFAINLKSFLSNHNTSSNSESKEKTSSSKTESQNVASSGISFFKRKNSVEHKEKSNCISPKSISGFSFPISLKMANSKLSPPLSPKLDSPLHNNLAKDSSGRSKVLDAVGHARIQSQSDVFATSPTFMNEMQAKFNSQLKVFPKNQENNISSGSKKDLDEVNNFKPCPSSFVGKTGNKEVCVQILKPPRKVIQQNISEGHQDKIKSAQSKSCSDDIYALPMKKKNDKLDHSLINPYSYADISPKPRDLEHNNNSLYAEVNIVDHNFIEPVFNDDNCDNLDSDDEISPPIPDKMPSICANIPSVNSSTEELSFSRTRKNRNPMGFFQKVAKKAEGVFSSSPGEPSSSTSEAVKLEADKYRNSDYQDPIFCFPHPFPKKPKGPRNLPPSWKVF